MSFMFKLGKREARHDPRVPRMSVALPGLAAPPLSANWYSSVKSWPMLANDQYGDCVQAAILHLIQSLSGYAEQLLMPTESDAISFYEAATGFNPADPSTDQGSYVLGSGGVMDFWLNQGVTIAGHLNKVQAFLQITQKNPTQWCQGIHFFGGMLTGLQLPEAIVSSDQVPAIWADFSGPVAGGHEILINGYNPTSTGGRLYDLVSWGHEYQATEEFLLHVVDETVVIIDPVEIEARGVNVAGFSPAQLVADMAALRG